MKKGKIGKKPARKTSKSFFIINKIKRFWNWLWNDNSILSWIVLLVLTFVFIKFIFYPVIGLAFSTSHPIVAVVSGSMEHNTDDVCIEIDPKTGQCMAYDKNSFEICGNRYSEKKDLNLDEYFSLCGDWYIDHYNITKEQFGTFDFSNGFDKGDVIFVYGEKPKNIKVGDVIIWRTDYRREPIIHRVVNIREINKTIYFTTKGDSNPVSINESFMDEMTINEEDLIGKGIFRVPKLGYIKLILTGMAFN